MTAKVIDLKPDRRGDNLYFQYKMAAVCASMTDDDLKELSDGNTRILTSLRCQRERLRDPRLDRFIRAHDHWLALTEAILQGHEYGGEQEIEAAHQAVMDALDRLDEP
jgi:hypothetical protein